MRLQLTFPTKSKQRSHSQGQNNVPKVKSTRYDIWSVKVIPSNNIVYNIHIFHSLNWLFSLRRNFRMKCMYVIVAIFRLPIDFLLIPVVDCS